MVKHQADKLWERLRQQTRLVLKKLERNNNQEISVAHIELVGLAYIKSNKETPNSSTPEKEAFNELLSKVDGRREMKMLTERFVEGKSYAELAKEMKIPETSVRRKYNKIFKKLRNRL